MHQRVIDEMDRHGTKVYAMAVRLKPDAT
jgi:hypothetical protein